ncbi:hypothetical protein [Streptomyces sp. NPDC056817]|uniref:hypothetical protein n=1 Tax=Streptomyces sp. NPDC056817 TaxID=3345950 RepID=UPI0036818A48
MATPNALEKARAAAEKAAQELVALESQEAEKAAEKAAQRLEAVKDQAARFLAARQALESKVKGEKPSAAKMAEALEAGTLGALIAEYLARRDAVNMLRDHARSCARLLGEDDRTIGELRYVDPAEELLRWQADAIAEARRIKANSLAADVLADYEAV